MKYNSNIHHRRSIRLKNYDYSQAGLYFITICTQNHLCLFGQIENGEMKINDAGHMTCKWWNELDNKYHNVELHEYVTMPNHFHGIIQIVGADLRVCPDDSDKHDMGKHTGSPLHAMVQWFKTMTTNEYIRNVKKNGWSQFLGKLWQRNFYEHIIRNEKSYDKITEYIVYNPMRWMEDKYYEKPPLSPNRPPPLCVKQRRN